MPHPAAVALTCGMNRSVKLLLILAASTAVAHAQSGAADPAFQKIPFDQWLGERSQPHFRWTAGVSRPELSFHQRFIAQVEVKLDGRDLESRRGEGRLVFFLQITDHDGNRYQDHGSIELSKLSDNLKSINLEYVQRMFILPGEYRLAVAVLDTNTGDHSTTQSQFRVPPPQRESLPGAWRDLPPVEFIPNDESVEGWYLPDVKGRLHWASTVQSATRLNVVLNVALSAPIPGTRLKRGNDLSALLPTLKAISQTGTPALSEHVELLDLSRRRAVFQQDEVRELDFPRLKESLAVATTASIDLSSLSERHHDAQFFVSQIRRIIRASEKSCTLVVLTPSVAFEPGEDLDPIALEALPPCRVFYIRYREQTKLVFRRFEPEFAGRRRGPPREPQYGNHQQTAPDQLAATLKPLNPKIFDVETPDQMARALAEVEKALRTASEAPPR